MLQTVGEFLQFIKHLPPETPMILFIPFEGFFEEMNSDAWEMLRGRLVYNFDNCMWNDKQVKLFTKLVEEYDIEDN